MPIKVALVHWDSERKYNRSVGWWSYDVPEFEVKHFGVQPMDTLDGKAFNAFDLVLVEDHKTWVRIEPRTKAKVAYFPTDSNGEKTKYEKMHRYASRNAFDIILLDSELHELWRDVSKWILPLRYCVNDKRYFDSGVNRDIDIGFYYVSDVTGKRAAISARLKRLAEKYGYTCITGARQTDYHTMMQRTKVIINQNQLPQNWPHRVFDAMACGGCVVSSQLRKIDGDGLEVGTHYIEYDEEHIEGFVLQALRDNKWQAIAQAGNSVVMEKHTWAIRAKQFSEALKCLL